MTNRMEFLCFQAAGQYLGIEARYVHRVVDDGEITPVPLQSSCYMGLMYSRGDLFDVIHVGDLLGQQQAVQNENPRIILLKWAGKKLALVPDKIIGMISIKKYDKTQSVYHYADYTIQVIMPDDILKKVSEIFNGS
ncbi:MAG: chemotaxis protein CheW [Thermodesulfobacteriota bacterium]|nr:chemotaxis protein CheW [Thermodesulfobacteriota bacterium]